MLPTLVVQRHEVTFSGSGDRAAHERETRPQAREFATLTIPPRTIPPPPPAPVRGPWPVLLFLASALTLTGTVLGWVLR